MRHNIAGESRLAEETEHPLQQACQVCIYTFKTQNNADPCLVLLRLTQNYFSLMVKFDEVRTGGNMMPTATLAVGTTEGKLSGERKLRK